MVTDIFISNASGIKKNIEASLCRKSISKSPPKTSEKDVRSTKNKIKRRQQYQKKVP